MVFRHTVLFRYKDSITPEQIVLQKKGLAYLAFGCPTVRAYDFGTDLFGGSTLMREVKPWKRTPLWKARAEGPICNYDVALHEDFDDMAGFEEYGADYRNQGVHWEVSEYNEAVCDDEFTARADWWYDGPPINERGGVRHTSLFLWDDGVTDSQKGQAKEALQSLRGSVPGVRRVTTGDNFGARSLVVVASCVGVTVTI